MEGFQLSFHVPGTLAADKSIVWTVPFNCQLTHVSAVGSNAHDGIVSIGSSADVDLYLDETTFGVSDTPQEFDWNDFIGGQFPHIAKGTVVAITLDFNGAAGTACHDFSIVLTFTVG